MSSMKTWRAMMLSLAYRAFFLSACLVSVSASAATVNGTVRYWDSRTFRSTNTGSYLSQVVGNRALDGAYVILMDMDGGCADVRSDCGENDDDLVNALYTNSSGFYSVSQNWQGTPIPLNEVVYLLVSFYDTAGNIVNDNVVSPVFEFGVGSNTITVTSSTTTLNFNATCFDDTLNNTRGFCDNQADVTANFLGQEARTNLFASMIDVRRRGVQGSTGSQWGYFPDHPDGWCTDGMGADPAGVALDGEFCVTDAANSHVVAHEMGHNIQSSILGVSMFNTCTSGETWTGSDPEKCVAAEAFAHFASGATWWNQNAVSPTYRGYLLEGNTSSFGGVGTLKCLSSSSSPHRRRGNMARWFWDLYDTTGVGTDDAVGDDETHSFWDLANIYGLFPAGTADRQNDESGSNGRNVWDYIYWADPLGWWFAYEAGHNCINGEAGGW